MKIASIQRIAGPAVLFLIGFSSPASAQNITLLLPERVMEIGIQYRWTHVDIQPDYRSDELDYGETSIVSAYGITEYATLSAEFMIGDERFNSFETEVRYYLLGAGIQGLIWKYDRYEVSGGAGLTTTFLVDRTGEMPDDNYHSFLANAVFQASFRWRDVTVTPWLGPVAQYFTFERESGNRNAYSKANPDHLTGGAAGVNLLLYENFHIYCSFLYINFAQPRIGASYRF